MKQISNKEYEKYQQYQIDRLHGRILTPDGLRVVCAGLDNDPEKIGKHMLEMLAKFRNGGVVEQKNSAFGPMMVQRHFLTIELCIKT